MPPNKVPSKVTTTLLGAFQPPTTHRWQGCLTRLAYARELNLAVLGSDLAASHLAASLAELRSNSVRIDESMFARTDVPSGNSATVFPSAGGTL